MSFISKIPEILQNRNKIWEGLRNKVFKQEHVEEVYKARLEICEGCDKLDLKGSSCTVPGTQPCCGECGCSIGLKLRSLASECPLKKWEAITNIQEEELIQKQIHANRQGGSNLSGRDSGETQAKES